VPQRSNKRREPPPITEASLDAAALAYLDRFDSTAQNLRRVLMKRVWKSARAHDSDPEEGKRIVNAIVDRFRGSGLVDDVRYAATMARGLRQRGGSLRGIQQKLRARGVSEEDVGAALDAVGVDAGDGELAAATVFARKRRLGPFRVGDADPARRRKDLAAMARAGFRADVCWKVLDADRAELDDLDLGDP
jgi:regulatory protein